MSWRETTLLARSLDILVADLPAEARLAGLLELLAGTVGARRAAVLAAGGRAPDRGGRRSTTKMPRTPWRWPAWLDAHGPGSRAERAARGPAAVAIARTVADPPAAQPPRSGAGRLVRAGTGPIEHHYAWIEIPSSGRVDPRLRPGRSRPTSSTVGRQLPPQLARHAAVALALVSEQVAVEREAADLRARDVERERYVSTVAHDLRTPLTGLGGYLDLIGDGRVDDPAVRRVPGPQPRDRGNDGRSSSATCSR